MFQSNNGITRKERSFQILKVGANIWYKLILFIRQYIFIIMTTHHIKIVGSKAAHQLYRLCHLCKSVCETFFKGNKLI